MGGTATEGDSAGADSSTKSHSCTRWKENLTNGAGLSVSAGAGRCTRWPGDRACCSRTAGPNAGRRSWAYARGWAMGKRAVGAVAGLQAEETGRDWAERVRRERGRLGWAGWSLGQIGERSLFSIFPFFYFVFKTEFKHKPNQIQIWLKIHFLIQIKMRNFGKFSKNNFLQLFKCIYFLIFFSFFSFTSKPFLIFFQKQFEPF